MLKVYSEIKKNILFLKDIICYHSSFLEPEKDSESLLRNITNERNVQMEISRNKV